MLAGAAADFENVAAIRKVLPQYLEYRVSVAITGIGVGFGGPVAPHSGAILASPRQTR